MIKVVIIDDEIHALRAMEYLLKEEKNFEVCGVFTNPIEAMNAIKVIQPQIVFLDINMPQLNGIDVASNILESCPWIEIVFITAYDQYAVGAFEVNALDYILKPIAEERLKKTLSRILYRNESKLHINNKEKICIKTFGELSILEGNREPLKWRSQKTKELFAFLFFNQGREISKDIIIDKVFYDFDYNKAIRNLHNGIYHIRKSLMNYGISEENICIKDRYRLYIHDVEIDVQKFKDIFKSQHLWEDIGALERAKELYKGNYLGQENWQWAMEERVKFEAQYIQVLMQLATVYEIKKDYVKAEELLLEAFKINPFEESGTKALLKVYKNAGKKKAIIKHYREYEKILMEELGIKPEEEIQRIIKNL